MHTLLIAFAVLIALTAPTAAAPLDTGMEIPYELAEPGRVSLGVYGGDGRLVRTLLTAAPQAAGRHTVAWDGLDSRGESLPVGAYRWKLLQTDGLTSEYLLNLGISTGIHHWPGQHGGLIAVAGQGDDLYVTAAMSEGSPQTVNIKADGTHGWASPALEGWGGGLDLAVDGDSLFFLGTHPKGRTIYVQEAATGKLRRRFDLARPAARVGPRRIARAVSRSDTLPDDELCVERISLPLANGTYHVRLDVGDGGKKPARASIACQGETKAEVDLESDADGRTAVEFPAEVKDGTLTLAVWLPRKDAAGEEIFELPLGGIEVTALPERIAAWNGELVVAFPQAVVWVDRRDGTVLDEVSLDHVRDIDIPAAGTVLAIVGNQLVSLSRNTKTPVVRAPQAGLSPLRLCVDRTSGEVFVFDGADRDTPLTAGEQVKRFDKDFKLVKTYGRAGGRRTGRYEPRDFLRVSDILADGAGGFYVTEYGAAPRRLARFDGEGNVLGEWFGGQQFYTYAEAEPDAPQRVWMDSEWGWVMQIEIDYAVRSWKPVATYRWAAELEPAFFHDHKMAHRMHPVRHDLDGDGSPELYLWSDAHSGLLLRVDEAAGLLRPVAGLGLLATGSPPPPVESLPKAWREAVAAFPDPIQQKNAVRTLRGFGWADADGDSRMQGGELRLLPSDGHGFSGGSSPCIFLDRDLTIIQGRGWAGEQQPAWTSFPSGGTTPTGAPSWDWGRQVAGAVSPFPSTFALCRAADRAVFTLSHGGGDGYLAQEVSGPGHGWQWPANLTDRSTFSKHDAEGRPLWRIDLKAAVLEGRPGQMHYPTCFAGLVHGCIGVCDKIVRPCEFWTEDGLYVGGLLDRRADDGLPGRVYGWWRGDMAAGDGFDNLAIFQYDMIVGGSLAQLPDGSVVFFGAGWNSVPVFRITGWDRFVRQEGSITLDTPTPAAARKGTGLTRQVAGRQRDADKDELDAILEEEPTAASPGVDGLLAGIRNAAKPVPAADNAVWFEPRRPKRQWPEDVAGQNPASVTWEGFLEPRLSEAYTLGIYTDGKATLFVGDELVIDAPAGSFRKTFSLPLPLQAGRKVPLRLTWSGDPRTGRLHLVWESPSRTIEHVPADALYPSQE